MAKFLADTILDRGLELLQASANRVTLCNAQPTTYAEGMTTYALGTLAAASGNYAIADLGGGGRQVTYGPGTVVVGTTGTITHVAWLGTSGSGTLIHVGTCASTAVTAAGTVVIGTLKLVGMSDIA